MTDWTALLLVAIVCTLLIAWCVLLTLIVLRLRSQLEDHELHVRTIEPPPPREPSARHDWDAADWIGPTY